MNGFIEYAILFFVLFQFLFCILYHFFFCPILHINFFFIFSSPWLVVLGTCFKHHRHELEEAGFDCNTHPELKHTARQRYPFEIIRAAFLAYKEINNDLLVPNKFKIDEGNEAYPKETWGMPLGTTTYLLPCLLSYFHLLLYLFL